MTPEEAASAVAKRIHKAALYPLSVAGHEWLIRWFRDGHNHDGELRCEIIATPEGEVAVKQLARRIEQRGGPAINGLCHLGALTEVGPAVLQGLVPVISLGDPGKAIDQRSVTRLCNDT